MVAEKKVQVQLTPEVEEEVRSVLKDVLMFLEGWCACSESALFSRAVQVLKKLGLLEEFKERYGLPKDLHGIKGFLYDFIDFLRERLPELYEEVEEEVYDEEENEEEKYNYDNDDDDCPVIDSIYENRNCWYTSTNGVIGILSELKERYTDDEELTKKVSDAIKRIKNNELEYIKYEEIDEEIECDKLENSGGLNDHWCRGESKRAITIIERIDDKDDIWHVKQAFLPIETINYTSFSDDSGNYKYVNKFIYY